MFPEQVTAELERIRSRFPVPKAAMVPVLRRVQVETGWLDRQTQAWVAQFLSVEPIEVHEVVSFYPMLYDRPVAKNVIHVCRTLSCDACGARELWMHLQQRLGIGRGETTADGRFTLRAAECLASCGTSPVVLVNMVRHEGVTAKAMDALLEKAS